VHGEFVKKFAIIIISTALLASVALNIRLISVLEDYEEDQMVNMFKGFQRDNAILYHLQHNNQEKSEEMLLEDIKIKGTLFFIFSEEGRLSEKALKLLEDNKKKYDEST